MAKNPFDGPYGSGSTEYERYLGVEKLLTLQKAPEKRTHPDELLFQTVHQVEELWMKLAIHELGEASLALEGGVFPDARNALERAARLLGMCEQQLRLFETMQPVAYLEIRKGLGQGSGLDSPGFNRLNEVAPSLWKPFEAALAKQNVELIELYQHPDKCPALLAVAEQMVSLDANMQRFKLEHLNVVRRIIGMGTASLRGNPNDMLEKSAKLTYFPMLWAVRDRLYNDFKAGELKT